MENPKKKNQLRKYAALSGAGLQMGITIYLGAFFGKKLDAYYNPENKTYTIVLTLIALVISIYSVIQQLNKINNKYDK